MRLKHERKKAKLSQAELSRLSGVSQSFISRMESGEVNDAAFGVLDDLARVLRRRGRKVDAADLRPHRRPLLIKGAFVGQKRKRARRDDTAARRKALAS